MNKLRNDNLVAQNQELYDFLTEILKNN